jgi:hypothetical protein
VIGNNIFAGTENNIYISTNNGTNWFPTTLNNQYISSLTNNENYIFAGTSTGVYLSSNYGISWQQTSLYNKSVYSLLVFGNNIFAGTNMYGVYLSTNNGTDWTLTGLVNKVIYTLAVNGNNVFAGTAGYGIFLSTNNGINWSQTAFNTGITVYTISVSENNIISGASDGVYLSTNNGLNWIKKNQGFNNLQIAIHAFLITNNYIFAGTDGYSVWRRSLSEIIGVQNISTEIPKEFKLYQNYPNPFNPKTKIIFEISNHPPNPPSKGEVFVSMKVYNILGKEIQTLVNEGLQPGMYEVTFDGSDFPSGIYFYQLRVGEFVETKRFVLLK